MNNLLIRKSKSLIGIWLNSTHQGHVYTDRRLLWDKALASSADVETRRTPFPGGILFLPFHSTQFLVLELPQPWRTVHWYRLRCMDREQRRLNDWRPIDTATGSADFVASCHHCGVTKQTRSKDQIRRQFTIFIMRSYTRYTQTMMIIIRKEKKRKEKEKYRQLCN